MKTLMVKPVNEENGKRFKVVEALNFNKGDVPGRPLREEELEILRQDGVTVIIRNLNSRFE